MTLKGFIDLHHIKASARMIDRNPNMVADEGWSNRASHYSVTITGRFDGRKRRLTVPFSMGEALCHEPEAEDVLDCLASDAATVENAQSFEDFASELGYDADSRKAERIYKTCQRQAEKLKAFVGDQYETLLWNTERG